MRILRETLVSLTERGRKLDRAIRRKLEETERIMERGLSDEEKAMLKRLLLQVRENMVADGAPAQRGEEPR